MAPLFSVVMPTHNRPDYLAEAIASVVAQTEQDWELIVVDDASQPPAEVPADPRIILVRNSTSGGPAEARNTGIRRAAGSHIAFLDDDDGWAPTRLAHAREAHQKAQVVVCGEGLLGSEAAPNQEVGPSQEVLTTLRHGTQDWILDDTVPHTGRVSVAQSVCPEFDTAYRAAEDLDWWLRLASTVSASAWVDAPDWLWRRHRGVRNDLGADRRIEGSLQLLAAHQEYFAAHPRARAFRWRRISVMWSGIDQPTKALRAAFSSLKAKPTFGGLKALVKAITGFARWRKR